MTSEDIYELYRQDWHWQTAWQDLPPDEQLLWNELAAEINKQAAEITKRRMR